MVKIPATPSPNPLQNLSEKNLSNLLKVGQQLTVNIEKIQGNEVSLKIGQSTLSATTADKSLQPGTARVMVQQTQPNIVISLAPSPKGTDEAPKALQQLNIQAALRQLLPNQMPLAQTFQQLNTLNNLPMPLQSPLQQVLDLIRKNERQLSGKDLKSSIENSGLFMESKLKNLPAGEKKGLLSKT